MLKRLLDHPVRLILAAVVGIFLLYEVSARFLAYTGDAYVTSDVVVLSAEVAGPLATIAVENNQAVGAGAPLFTIEATPYRLAVSEAAAALEQAKASLALAGDQVAAAEAAVAAAKAVASDADLSLDRARSLSGSGFDSEAALDGATRNAATARASLLSAQSDLGVARQRVTVATASRDAAEAALASANYRLAKTSVTAPAAGRIAPFTRRQGDSLSVGDEVMAIVTTDRTRVVANIPERHLARLALGQKALLTVGNRPWQLMHGHVSGIAPGIARDPTAQRIIPYVAPSTDWVRLPRLFPIEITIDDPPNGDAPPLGADARVLVWF